jgi:NAD(P) transhydrogenase subunit alpha
MLPTSSTWMFAQNIYNLLKYLVKDNHINIDLNDEITASILVCQNNKLVHEGTLEAMGLK